MEQNETALRDTPIEFTGSGREYFGIWIVNILLTIVTLGIYSAWAKVRTRKYFYNSTRIDGAVFDYHANPIAILKGWAIVVVILLLQQVLVRINVLYGLGMILLILAFIPWAMVRSRVFNLLNTSYRNVRFHFDRDYRGLYAIFLTAPLPIIIGYGMMIYLSYAARLQGTQPPSALIGLAGLIILVGFLFVPYFIYRFYRYIISHSSYGNTYFESGFKAGNFYMIYFKAFGLGLIMVAILWVTMVMVIGATAGHKETGSFLLALPVMLIYLIGIFYIRYFIEASKLNTIWGKTTISNHRFGSHLKPLGFMWVMMINTVLIIITFGLYIPWAKVRMLRYRLDKLVLQVDGELDNFAAKAGEEMGALGAELGEAFDFVISL